MKLYTEKDLTEYLKNLPKLKPYNSVEDLLSYIPSIELPTEEEVYNQSPHYDGSVYSTSLLHIGFRDGAKWVIDKIKNQQQ